MSPHRAVITLLLIAALVWVRGAKAGLERVTFPAAYKSGVLYNVVDREDQKEVHEQYTDAAAIEAAKAGKPLPLGTVITSANYKALLDVRGNPLRDAKGHLMRGELARVAVMEKRAGWGAEYPESLRNGEWEFAAFNANGTVNGEVDLKACMVCHKPHRELDYVKTYLAMAGKRVELNPLPVPPGATVATVLRFAVSPTRLTVHAGAPVTWINVDEAPHQFLVEAAGMKTGYLLKGQTGTIVLSEPGHYTYRDTFYPAVESLQGVLEVIKP
jgi:Cytochrome P460